MSTYTRCDARQVLRHLQLPEGARVCCSCCCGVMEAQRNGTPMIASSGYVAQVNADLCAACGECAGVCQFGAISVDDGLARIDAVGCMGCGVCVAYCPQEAIDLVRDASRGEPLEIQKLSAKAVAASPRQDQRRAPPGSAALQATEPKTVAINCHVWYNTGMEFSQLLEIVGDEPVFETGLLLAGNIDPANVRRQLSRWTQTGRIYQLRRGMYALAPPFQKVKAHPFLVANRLVRGSYVSLQSALAYHSLIPEAVPVATSVTARRPARWDTPLGVYEYHHVKKELLFGYQRIEVGNDQWAFVATGEKALLDLVHLQPRGDNPEYLRQLRLQNLEQLDLDRLLGQAARANSPKLCRAADRIVELAGAEAKEYETL